MNLEEKLNETAPGSFMVLHRRATPSAATPVMWECRIGAFWGAAETIELAIDRAEESRQRSLN